MLWWTLMTKLLKTANRGQLLWWSPLWHHFLVSWPLIAVSTQVRTSLGWCEKAMFLDTQLEFPCHCPVLGRWHVAEPVGPSFSWSQTLKTGFLMKKACVLSYPLSAQRRLWSDWTDAQADLSLHWAHSHFVGFITRWLNYYKSTIIQCSMLSVTYFEHLICTLTQNWVVWWINRGLFGKFGIKLTNILISRLKTENVRDKMSHVMRKFVFGDARSSDQTTVKPVCSATASTWIILTRQRITKVLIRLCGYTGWALYGFNRFSHDMAQIKCAKTKSLEFSNNSLFSNNSSSERLCECV